MAEKVTYATAKVEDPEWHRQFDEALSYAHGRLLGADFPMIIAGKQVYSKKTFTKKSPIDVSWEIGTFPLCREEDVQRAIDTANYYFDSWRSLPWEKRVEILRRVADLIKERSFELAAVVALEVGKNRLEAYGDVTETAELILYYCDQMEKHNGYVTPMEPEPDGLGQNTSVMKPYGAWAVISPFNFPVALPGGPMGAALVTGNTVVFKPASETPLTGYLLTELFHEGGVPPEALHFVTGNKAGPALVQNPITAGLTFIGSREVGKWIEEEFPKHGWWPRPLVLEMGGKNAAIVSRHADLELAAEGGGRSAFGLSGQKCTACSRVFVEESVYFDLLDLLVEKTKKLVIGDPTKKDTSMGPVINRAAYEKYQQYIEELAKSAEIVCGGKTFRQGGKIETGWFVEPTIVAGLDPEHRLFQEEMFLPIVCVRAVEDLDEAMDHTNRSQYGLAGGSYSRKPEEIKWFLDWVKVGVIHVNRRSGATTNAWPGRQPFGGWKASGSTGFGSGGPYYLLSYLREQSQTVYWPKGSN